MAKRQKDKHGYTKHYTEY